MLRKQTSPQSGQPLLTERPYQVRILDAARKSLRKNRHVAVYAPQGSGKGPLCAFMARDAAIKGNKTAILTHRVEVLKQDFNKMEMLGLNVAAITQKTLLIPKADVYCISVQTLASRCNRHPEWVEFVKTLDFIIEDEAHRGEFPSIHKYFKKDVWAVGLSGTLLRSGSMEQLGDFYSDIVAPVMPSELIALGNILPSQNYIFDAPKLDDIAVDYSSGDYNQKQLQKRFAKAERYAGIIDNYKRICPGKKVIVFTTGGQHCIDLTKEFCEAGIKAKYLLSARYPEADALYSGERSAVLDELRRGDIDVLLSVEMLSTGLDIPQLEGVILDFSTKSYTKYQQCVARPDRPYGDQKFFYVLDFGANVQTYGKFEADPVMSLWHRSGGGGVAPSKICPEDRADHEGRLGCGRILPVSMMICKYCGYTWLTDKQVYEVELTRIVESKKDEEESIQGYCARKRLEGWSNNRILMSVVVKNKDNQKKAFMEAIKVLRTESGELISPTYWWFFKKNIVDKVKRKAP
jgi:superfamily II DNA or RNA helicase